MKATIQKIIEDISALSVPMDPAQIQKIFAIYPEFTPTSPPKDLEHQWAQLVVILKLTEEGIKLKEKIDDLKLHEEEITQYTERGIVLQRELSELELELVRLQTEIMQARTELTELYNRLLLAINKQGPQEALQEASPDSATKMQLKAIIDIRAELENDIKLLTLPTAKLKLLELKDKQTVLLNDIHRHMERYHFDLAVPAKEHLDSWQITGSTLSNTLATIIRLKPEFEKLQEQFADCLSTKDAQKKIDKLQQSKDQVIHELSALAQKITEHKLSKALQIKLTQEFQATTKVQHLIDSYSTKVDSVLSYIDPRSWSTWYTNKTAYNEQQNEIILSLDFLTLLKNQKEKQEQQNDLTTQIEVLAKISNSKDMSAETESTLIDRTRILVNELPACRVPSSFSPSASAADYYLLLIDNISLIPEKIKLYETLVSLVNLLLPIMTEQLQYRSDYNLPEAQDNLLPSIDELQKAIPSTTGLIQKKEQLQACELYLEKIRLLLTKLKPKTKQEEAITQKQEDIEFNIEILKIALENKNRLEKEKTLAIQIEQHTTKFSMLQNDIAEKMRQIKADDNLSLVKDETVHSATTEVVVADLTRASEPKQKVEESSVVVVDGVHYEHSNHVVVPVEVTHHDTPLTPLHSKVSAPAEVIRIVELLGTEKEKIISTSTISEQENAMALRDSSVKKVLITLNSENGGVPVTRKPTPDLSIIIPVLAPAVEKPVIDVVTDDAAKKALIVGQVGEDRDVSPVVHKAVLNGTLPLPKQPIMEGAKTPIVTEHHDKELVVDSLQAVVTTINSPIHTKPAVDGVKVIVDPTITLDRDALHEVTLPPSQNPEALNQLEKWHIANIEALAKYPEELRTWYLDLYAVATLAVKQSPYSYKYSHLIRDVFFELHTKQEIDVLYTYIRMCPSPKEHCEVLLSLKPDHKISEQLFDEKEEQLLPEPLQKLYRHYKNLKERHSVAAELLLQTIHSLHFIYQNQAKVSVAFVIPQITEDPRYDFLKRQRGFLRVWELIEDFCRLIIGKITGQPEYEYRKRPSFFKTCSEQLIEEAESFVSKTKSPSVAAG